MIHAHDVEAELWRFVDDGDPPSSNDLWRCIQYTARKKATALPSSFTRDSEMHLVDQHMIDTTDRHLVRAFCEQFRPGATEKDMQKPLFYLTPFITCSKCNSILFIDAANARCFGAPVPDEVRLKRGGNETLAVCPGCAMTEDLQVGAHDFLEDIEDARSRRPVVLWCLHFVDVTRVHLTMTWVVSFFISRPFGHRDAPRRRGKRWRRR